MIKFYILLHEILKFTPAEFIRSALKQEKCLEHHLSAEQIDAVANHHKEFLRVIIREDIVRGGIENFGPRTSLKAA